MRKSVPRDQRFSSDKLRQCGSQPYYVLVEGPQASSGNVDMRDLEENKLAHVEKGFPILRLGFKLVGMNIYCIIKIQMWHKA